MIIPTPNECFPALEFLDPKYHRDWPIVKKYPGYESCFLLLHPFEKIRPESAKAWSPCMRKNRRSINENYVPLSWTRFLEISGISSYKKLDRALRYVGGSIRSVDKNELSKLVRIVNQKEHEMISPVSDSFPDHLLEGLLLLLIDYEYNQIYVEGFGYERKLAQIADVGIEDRLPWGGRFETPDRKFLALTDFDSYVSYLLGPELAVSEIVEKLDLEGFFCDEHTTESWSYEEINPEDKMDRHAKL